MTNAGPGKFPVLLFGSHTLNWTVCRVPIDGVEPMILRCGFSESAQGGDFGIGIIYH